MTLVKNKHRPQGAACAKGLIHSQAFVIKKVLCATVLPKLAGLVYTSSIAAAGWEANYFFGSFGNHEIYLCFK